MDTKESEESEWTQGSESPKTGRMRLPTLETGLGYDNDARTGLSFTLVSLGFLLDTVLGRIMSPRICESDLIWKWGPCRCAQYNEVILV